MSDKKHEYTLGEDNELLSLGTREEHRQHALDMLSQARKSLHIFSYSLDPSIYDNAEFIDAVKALAIANPHSKIYILIQEPKGLILNGHRIIELSRRLSSHIFLQKAGIEDQNRFENFLLVDETGYIRRSSPERYEGTANYYDPGETHLHLRFFNEAWARSAPEPKLKRLNI